MAENIKNSLENNEMDLEVVWNIEKKPGKHIKLYLKNKEQTFSKEIQSQGRYSLALHTPDFLPGGEVGRKIECLVSVYKNLSEPPGLITEDKKELCDYGIDHSFAKHLVLRDTYEIHSKDSTTVVEFELKSYDIPACIQVIAKTHTPFIGMRFAGKLLRNVDLKYMANNDFTFKKEEFTNSEWMFKTLSIESITNELERESEEKNKAFQLGMIRPFLFLVSMHPIMRVQIGDLLGINLLVKKHNNLKNNDPHVQALKLLDKHIKGLGSIADHSWETGNPISSKSNWYDCLYRGTTEIHPTDHISENKASDTTKVSKDVSAEEMNELEISFLESARDMHVKEMNKLQGDTTILTDTVDSLEKHKDIQQLYALLKIHNVTSEIVCRFLLEITVVADYHVWLHYHDEKKEEKDKEESTEDKIKAWKAEKDKTCETPIKKDDTYEKDIIGGLRSQLLRGTYDPRGLGDTGKAVGKKVGQFVAKKLFEYFVLLPIFPYLVIPFKIYCLADMVIGSNHQTVWVVCLQILLQRLLLAVHDISIDRYAELQLE